MNRRELLGAAVAGATVMAAANKAFAQDHDHDHMGHGMHIELPHAKLSEAARHCVTAGNVCLSHCLALFTVGDTSVSACAKSVYQMNAMCEALARLASAESPHLAAFAKVCHDSCLDCEKECRKHEKEHAECKACAESCAACAEECKKVMA